MSYVNEFERRFEKINKLIEYYRTLPKYDADGGTHKEADRIYIKFIKLVAYELEYKYVTEIYKMAGTILDDIIEPGYTCWFE